MKNPGSKTQVKKPFERARIDQNVLKTMVLKMCPHTHTDLLTWRTGAVWPRCCGASCTSWWGLNRCPSSLLRTNNLSVRFQNCGHRELKNDDLLILKIQRDTSSIQLSIKKYIFYLFIYFQTACPCLAWHILFSKIWLKCYNFFFTANNKSIERFWELINHFTHFSSKTATQYLNPAV